jgi:hypothetical protein
VSVAIRRGTKHARQNPSAGLRLWVVEESQARNSSPCVFVHQTGLRASYGRNRRRAAGSPAPPGSGPRDRLARRGAQKFFAGERRAAAWGTTLITEGRTVPPAIRGDWSAESSYAAGLQLADEPGCTAVFAANDQMAVGLLPPFRGNGLSVHEDW